jgi:hypothetical protein
MANDKQRRGLCFPIGHGILRIRCPEVLCRIFSDANPLGENGSVSPSGNLHLNKRTEAVCVSRKQGTEAAIPDDSVIRWSENAGMAA